MRMPVRVRLAPLRVGIALSSRPKRLISTSATPVLPPEAALHLQSTAFSRPFSSATLTLDDPLNSSAPPTLQTHRHLLHLLGTTTRALSPAKTHHGPPCKDWPRVAASPRPPAPTSPRTHRAQSHASHRSCFGDHPAAAQPPHAVASASPCRTPASPHGTAPVAHSTSIARCAAWLRPGDPVHAQCPRLRPIHRVSSSPHIVLFAPPRRVRRGNRKRMGTASKRPI